MNDEVKFQILKYGVQALLIFLFFKYIPKQAMATKDVLVITLIVVLSYIVLENAYKNYYVDDTTKCKIACEASEHMIDVKGDLVIPSIIQGTSASVNVSSSIPLNNTQNMTFGQTVSMLPQQTQQAQQAQQAQQTPKIASAPEESKQEEESKKELFKDKIIRNNDGSYTVYPWKNPQATSIGSRSVDGVMNDESEFNYIDFNSLPVGSTDGTFESGYSFLPPANWFPVPPHPPVCVAEKKCPVCPVYTEGTNIDLKDWNECRRISQPDEINVNYIEKKLNSGR